MSLPVVPVTVDSSLHFERSPTILHYISQSNYTCLPLSLAYQSPFLLSRLKSRYPATSCTIGYCLFLTSYMLSSKVICDDTYANKVSVS